MEYASSPVAQPDTHTRTSFSSNSFGITSVSNALNASGSRKKLVTLISSSLNSSFASPALPRRYCR